MKETGEERERTAMEDKARELLDAFIAKCIEDIHDHPSIRNSITMMYLGYSKAMQDVGGITLQEATEGFLTIVENT